MFWIIFGVYMLLASVIAILLENEAIIIVAGFVFVFAIEIVRELYPYYSKGSSNHKRPPSSQRTIQCPTCGSPATAQGDQWECGWCGDFGRLAYSEEPQDTAEQLSLSFSFVYHVDLPEKWNDLKAALSELVPNHDAALDTLLGKTLLHQISAGIQHRTAPLEPQKLQELELFLKETPYLCAGTPPAAVLKAAQSGVLYRQEAELSETVCGTFWRELLSALPPEQYYGFGPKGRYSLLYDLSDIYAYFDGNTGNEMGVAQDRCFLMRDTLDLHWKKQLLFHPDAARARRLLSRGELPEFGDICRDILVTEFPEEAAAYSPDHFEFCGWDELLDDVFQRDVPKGIRMWRVLLDIAAPRLGSDERLAEALLPDWDILDHPDPNTANEFLTALEDDRFARQIFQNAYSHALQRSLLILCRTSGRIELGRRCLEMTLENPDISEVWAQRLKRALAPEVSRGRSHAPPVEDLPDDGTVFHFCAVRLQGIPRAYFYLTGGIPLKMGDWVTVPFGREYQPRPGQIISIMDCTRSAAPWPPERTKTVLRMADAPSAPPLQ